MEAEAEKAAEGRAKAVLRDGVSEVSSKTTAISQFLAVPISLSQSVPMVQLQQTPHKNTRNKRKTSELMIKPKGLFVCC